MSVGPHTITGQQPAGLDHLERRVAALEQAIKAMQAARDLWASSFQGTLRFQDDQGDDWLTLGTVPLSGGGEGEPAGDVYGVALRGENGALLLGTQEGEQGLVMPEVSIPMTFYPTPLTLSVAGFPTNVWTEVWTGMVVTFPAHEVVHVIVESRCPAGQTAEVKLFDWRSGAATGAVALPAARFNVAEFLWVHPAMTGAYDPSGEQHLQLSIQFRRTGAGTSPLTAYPVNLAAMCSRRFRPEADTNGHPTLVESHP